MTLISNETSGGKTKTKKEAKNVLSLPLLLVPSQVKYSDVPYVVFLDSLIVRCFSIISRVNKRSLGMLSLTNSDTSSCVLYLENYLDCVENLPDDLQKHLSRMRELDVNYQGKTFSEISKYVSIWLRSFQNC